MINSKTRLNTTSVENRDACTEDALAASSLSAWPVAANHYTILGKVGRGAFATVYKALASTSHEKHDPSLCAIKIINLEHVDTNFVDIRLEVQTMRLSSHPNILACHTSFIHHTNLWLVMQLMDKGSSLHCLQTTRMLYNPLNQEFIQNRMHRINANMNVGASPPDSGDATRNPLMEPLNGTYRQEKQSLAPLEDGSTAEQLEEAEEYDMSQRTNRRRIIDMEQHITYILHETILGLKYIHENGQIHRDIKAGNILLDSHGTVRIADFGVSGWLVNEGSQRENTRTFVGTPCWMAPEVMEQIHGYDTKADIWSLGITALELAKGYAPYAKFPPMKVLLLTIQEDPPSLESYIDNDDDEYDGENSIDADNEGMPQIKEEWSDSFKSMIAWCLQKDPRNRPNCEELLAHKHFALLRDQKIRQDHMLQIKEDICDQIDDVGGEISFGSTGINTIPNAKTNMGLVAETKPNVTSNIDADNDATLGRNNVVNLPEEICGIEQRPSGTTWIFSDGSQVTASASGCSITGAANASGPDNTADEDGDFFDQFEQVTQGEDFKHPSVLKEEGEEMGMEKQKADSLKTYCTRTQEKERDDSDSDKDDLNAFMDQFEEQTSQRELS